MIRLNTSRGGFRDVYASARATPKLREAEGLQGQDAADRGGVLCISLAKVANESRRPDTLCLFLDSDADPSWISSVLAVFLTPAMRAIAERALAGSTSEASVAERDLATLAASFDLVPTVRSPARGESQENALRLTRGSVFALAAALLTLGAGVSVVAYRIGSAKGGTSPNATETRLESTSQAMISELSNELKSKKFNDLIQYINSPKPVPLDDKDKELIEQLTEAIKSPKAATFDPAAMTAMNKLIEALDSKLPVTLDEDSIATLRKTIADSLKNAGYDEAVLRQELFAMLQKRGIYTGSNKNEQEAIFVNEFINNLRSR